MARFKILWILYLFLSLMFVLPEISNGAISLTVNGAPEDSISLSPGQSCDIAIVSDNPMSYTAYIGFQVPDTLGLLTHTDTTPQAGTMAMVEECYEPPLTSGYRVTAMGDTTAGVHFIFLYDTYSSGQVMLGLWNSSGVLVDSVSITVQTQGPEEGACCNWQTGECSITGEEECLEPNEWLGAGSDCMMCSQMGACCNWEEGHCEEMTEWECIMQGWVFTPGKECNEIQCGEEPPPPEPPPLPTEIRRFEINQCFQDVCSVDRLTQLYDLIETKPFVVNVTLQLQTSPPETIPVKVKVDVFNKSTGKQIGRVNDWQKTIVKRSEPVECNFHFIYDQTKDMKAGDYKFSVVVKNDVNDANLFDWWNYYTFKQSKTVRFLVVQALFLELPTVPVPTLIGVWNPEYIKLAEQVFPVPKKDTPNVNRLEIEYLPSLTVSDLNSIVLLGKMQTELNLFNEKNDPDANFICAVITEILPGRPNGRRLRSSILLKPRGDATAYTLSHEMGHIFGLGEEYIFSEPNVAEPWILNQRYEFVNNPPPLKLAPGKFEIVMGKGRPHEGESCDWADDPASYRPKEQLLVDDGKTRWWCDGRYIGKSGYNVDKKSQVPSHTVSMMGSASDRWISGEEYKSLRKILTPSTPKAVSVLSRGLAPLYAGQRMIISGIVNIPERTAEISPLLPVQNLELSEEPNNANCMLVFKSGTGEVLADFNVAPLEGEEPNTWLEGPFSVVVDIPSNTGCIQINIDGVVADELMLTDNSPVVEVLFPNGGEEISGEMTITWTVTDADVNDVNNLKSTVEFSHNNGADWNILAMDIDVNELVIDSNYLPGGPNCLIKVTASDGWNLSSDVSDAPFSVTTKAPEVTILDPEDGAALMESWSMQGRCTAYDPETGDINDPNAIIWSSNIDGFLGKGELTGFQLSIGRHILTATVTDPEGKTAAASVIVRVIAHPADFNFDRFVNFIDVAVFAAGWQEACLEPYWCEGIDLDRNGAIDCTDLEVLADSWLWQPSQ